MKTYAIGFAILVSLGWRIAAGADHLLLNATFDHETPGTMPGTGGASAGQPVGNDSAIIGLAPFATPNLQIVDTDTFYAQHTRFEFLGSEEVTSGTVQIRAQVLFTGAGQPSIGIREQGTAAETFLDLYSGDNATTLYSYVGSTFHPAGAFTPNVILPLAIDASPDQKLVSVRLNGALLLDRVPIDLTGTAFPTRGIGSILFGVLNTAEKVSDVMRVDNLQVIACSSATFGDCLFVGDFDR